MSNYDLDDPVELLCALTEINSVNSTLVPGAPGESEIATFIGKWFTDRGFEVTRLEGTPGRPSIVACSKGATIVRMDLNVINVRFVPEARQTRGIFVEVSRGSDG